MNVRGAVVDRIEGDAAVVALLDQYEGAAAVFSPNIPADYAYATAPAVIVRAPTDLRDSSMFQGRRSEIVLSVSIYCQFDRNSNDISDVEDAALLIRDLFRGKSFVGSDGLTYQGVVTGPIPAPVTSPSMFGQLLLIRLYVGD